MPALCIEVRRIASLNNLILDEKSLKRFQPRCSDPFPAECVPDYHIGKEAFRNTPVAWTVDNAFSLH